MQNIFYLSEAKCPRVRIERAGTGDTVKSGGLLIEWNGVKITIAGIDVGMIKIP